MHAQPMYDFEACTSMCLSGFSPNDEDTTYKEFASTVIEKVSDCLNDEVFSFYDDDQRRADPEFMSWVICSTNNQQPEIEAHLEKFGFQKTPGVTNEKYHTRITWWFLPVSDVINKVIENA